MNSPRISYSEFRAHGYTTRQIESWSRQVIALCDADERLESLRLKHEAETLLRNRAAQKESEPWDDAPGVILCCGHD